jgi:hypothetical protein
MVLPSESGGSGSDKTDTPNKPMKAALLSRTFVGAYSVFNRIESSLATLGQPQGGLSRDPLVKSADICAMQSVALAEPPPIS